MLLVLLLLLQGLLTTREHSGFAVCVKMYTRVMIHTYTARDDIPTARDDRHRAPTTVVIAAARPRDASPSPSRPRERRESPKTFLGDPSIFARPSRDPSGGGPSLPPAIHEIHASIAAADARTRGTVSRFPLYVARGTARFSLCPTAA